MAEAKHSGVSADSQVTVSSLFRDPRLAAIFRRGEDGDSLTIPAPARPLAPQGEAA